MAGHIEDAVGLLEVEGEADGVPALAEGEAEFGARRIFENGDAGDVLSEETQAKGDAARHAEAPARVAGSVFAEIVVKPGISATGRQRIRAIARSQARDGKFKAGPGLRERVAQAGEKSPPRTPGETR